MCAFLLIAVMICMGCGGGLLDYRKSIEPKSNKEKIVCGESIIFLDTPVELKNVPKETLDNFEDLKVITNDIVKKSSYIVKKDNRAFMVTVTGLSFTKSIEFELEDAIDQFLFELKNDKYCKIVKAEKARNIKLAGRQAKEIYVDIVDTKSQGVPLTFHEVVIKENNVLWEVKSFYLTRDEIARKSCDRMVNNIKFGK